eukprot:XP_002261215.1 hypothetical protein, conserved in Plasmodium species [Plasmodium knowlesi strain H]
MNKPQGEWTGGRTWGFFLTCADIKKHEMRKIIVISDRKAQRRELIKKLHIHFRRTDEKSKRGKRKNAKLAIYDFLPVGLNDEVLEARKFEQRNPVTLEGVHTPCVVKNGVTSDSIRSEYESSHLYSTNVMRRKKMKKIVNDFFYNTLRYCISRDLSVVEISTYLSIMKYIFLKVVYGGRSHVVELFAEFKKVMLHHSINRSPSCVKIFSYTSLRVLIKYALNTFFRNFFFYKFIFLPIYDIHFDGGFDDLEKLENEEDDDDDIGFDEDATVCSLDTPSGGDYVRKLLNRT